MAPLPSLSSARPLRRAAFFFIASLILTPVARAQSTAKITVGKNVLVNTDRPTLTHWETIAAADPWDPSRLLASAWMNYPDKFSNCPVYLSVDGGKSWKIVLDSVSGGDPALAFGPDHQGFFALLDGLIYRSTDGGAHWDKGNSYPRYMVRPVPANGGLGLDREYLAADANPASKYYKNIYMHGTVFMQEENDTTHNSQTAIALYTSRDGGKTWLNPVLRPVFKPRWILGMANSVVLSDGTVVALFGIMNDYGPHFDANNLTTPNATLNVIVSDDGGANINRQVQVSSWLLSMQRSKGGMIPWLAADPGSAAFKDRLYAVWPDSRTKRSRVMFSYSVDKGKSWSPATVIDDTQSLPNDVDGPDVGGVTVAANKQGVVAVNYYTRREVGSRVLWDLRTMASLDGGDTWSSSVPVSDKFQNMAATDSWPISASAYIFGDTAKSGGSILSISADHSAEGNADPGDTSGFVAAADGTFVAIWIDNQTGTGQMWSAPITVNGTVGVNGGGELASLDDIGKWLSMEVEKKSQDRKTKRVTMTVRLKNISKDTIRGPVKVRVLSLSSETGTARVTGAANGLTGAGAVLDFTSTIPATGLLPDAKGAEKTLVFDVTNLGPFLTGTENRTQIVNLTGKVLGRRPPPRPAPAVEKK